MSRATTVVIGSAIGTAASIAIALWLIGGVIYGAYHILKWLRENINGLRLLRATRPRFSHLSEQEKTRRQVLKAHEKEVRAHEKAVRAVENEHQRSVHAAERELNNTTKEHARRLRESEKQLERIKKPPRLGAVWSMKGWAKLYETASKRAKARGGLSPALQATVDTAGNLAIGGRSTLTRMGTGALVAGPLGFMVGMAAKKDRKVDKRELYLTLQDDEWGAVIPFAPDRGQAVRQFALDVVNAARRAPAKRARVRNRLNGPKPECVRSKAIRSSVAAARGKLEAVSAEPLALPPAPAPLAAPTPESASGAVALALESHESEVK